MTSLAKPFRTAHPRPRRWLVNWPLWLGLILVGLIAYLSIRGPSLAPHDPLQENLIVRDEETETWHVPPFPAFAVAGFPLGSDEFGRDLYSRLLYAVRPTLQMVLVVASVRLVLGTLIGLVAGYFTGRTGRFFDLLIASALALPGLLIALGAIAVVGVELGVIAFVIGLSVTGWAETARLVREQTRSIRREIYVEAAYALGAADMQIIFRHVLRQIRAMLLMLFSFEVGSTLMLTAGLGFLGYYIGGDVWVDVADFVARRTSGTPELGQMLATAWVRLTDPWGLVSVGSVVFVAVLGFNLIGEGLRLRYNPELQMGRIRWISEGWGRLKLGLEQVWHPVDRLLFGSRIAVSMWMLAIGLALGYGAVTAWQLGLIRLPAMDAGLFFSDPATPTPPPPVDPAGDTSGAAAQAGGSVETQTSQAGTDLEEIAAADNGWTFTAPERLLIPPLVHANGSVYLLTEGQQVHVIGPDGQVEHVITLPEPVFAHDEQIRSATLFFPPILAADGAIVVASAARLYTIRLSGETGWEFPLDATPHAPPIAGPDGATFYQLDRDGTLYAFSSAEGLRWRHDLEDGMRPAYAFPVFSSTGEVFYSITNGTRGHIEALDANGALRWRTTLTTFNFYRPIQISPNGDWISLDDNVVRTDTGELVELADTEFPIDQFAMGRDGRTYLLSGSTVMEWTLGAGGRLDILRQVTVADPPNASPGLPPVLTVTEDGTVWIRFFSAGGSLVTHIWVGFDGTVYNLITVNLRDAFVLEEDYVRVGLTICELDQPEERVLCRGYARGAADPVWERSITGIARADDIQYQEGMLVIQTAGDTVQTVMMDLP